MDYTPSSSTIWNGSPTQIEATTTTSAMMRNVEEEDDEGNNKSVVIIEREHMFDKVVTPSDVGKLNRLVIPKQHAEKHFPLDSSNNEKGLLLNFEDRTGKSWRFRYSYWNSSQSYVMTKGWSRFVKEKKLDAGDIVSFQRGVGEVGKDKLFIDWRRRPDNSSPGLLSYPLQSYHHQYNHRSAAAGWGSSSNSNSPSSTFVLRSHPHSHPYPQPYPYPSPQGSTVWDHQGTPHLSNMSLMNVLPSQSYPPRRGTGNNNTSGLGLGHYGYGYGYGNVVNPYPVTGSLIFLRSSPSSITTSSTSAVGAAAATSSVLLPVPESEVNHPYFHHHHHRQQGGGGTVMEVQREEPMVYESVPVVQGKAAAKRLRLFGVNMECPISHQTHDFDILSSPLASSSTPNHPSSHHHHHYHHPQQQKQQQQQQQQHPTTMAISMGPPSSSSSSSFPSSPSNQLLPLQLRSLQYHGTTSPTTPPEKGKSPTSSSSMSLDLDI
ncbi:hypothetical protein SOVF_048930 [Spinacia oleracea]|uniref:B3 domain-containing transcription factor NGA3-like n=1 Tax=Spinacia oleracea TaxID=3562 RepID=A0A9R0K324_SPIOL|nr:B3 domain-containing transcription factor NGA3-like [Spinacia oleracea]KNA20800.1 hypothetical protein SOVF_048930 [Spinacia oleracea]